MLTLELPITQERVKEQMRLITDERKRLMAELHQVEALAQAVRACCKHPRTESGNTWGRWPYTECLDCGKEW